MSLAEARAILGDVGRSSKNRRGETVLTYEIAALGSSAQYSADAGTSTSKTPETGTTTYPSLWAIRAFRTWISHIRHACPGTSKEARLAEADHHGGYCASRVGPKRS